MTIFSNLIHRTFKAGKNTHWIYLLSIFVCSMIITICFFAIYTQKVIATTLDIRSNNIAENLYTTTSNYDYLFDICIDRPFTQSYNLNSISVISYSTSNASISANAIARVKSDLNSIASNSTLVSYSFLSIYNSNLVITSSYSDFYLPDFTYADLITQYNKGNLKTTLLNTGEQNTYLFSYSGMLLAARDLYATANQKLSTMFFILDEQEIFDRLSSGNPQNFIYPFFPDKTPVFDQYMDYPKELTPEMISSLISGKNYTVLHDTYYFIQTSDVSSWIFIQTYPRSSLTPKFSDLLQSLLPTIILLTIIILLLSIVFSIWLNKPLKRILSKQDSLTEMLANVSDNVLSQLFVKLLSGETVLYNDIQTALDSIHTGFLVNSVYVSCVCKLKQTTLSDTPSCTPLIKIMRQKLAQSHSDKLYYILPMDEDLIAIILSFNTDISIAEGKQAVQKVSADLMEALQTGNYSVEIQSGHLYHSILDLRFSYIEALLALNTPSESHSEQTVSIESDQSSSEFELMERRTGQIISLIQNQCSDNAFLLFDRFFNELQQSTPAEQLPSTYDHLLQYMIENMLLHEYINLTRLSEESEKAAGIVDQFELSSDYTDRIKDTFHHLLELFSDMIEKQHNPHIISTLTYIENNYGNANLSLLTIAEAIGISSNYLSRLFSDTMGIRLLDYLNKYRTKKSAEELVLTTKSITEIAECCGFTNARNYIRVFHKYYSMSPGQYRKTHTPQ